MLYEKTVIISPELEARVKHYMSVEPTDESAHEFDENHTIQLTAVFPDGIEMDIKCCGVQSQDGQSNLAWAEAVVFDHGAEVCCSEPVSEPGLVGEWYLAYNNNEYIARIVSGNA